MRKIVLSFLFLSILFFMNIKEAGAATFGEAISEKQPVAVLIYADWADDAQQVLQSFKTAELQYGGKYNFVTLNIALPETKEFNKSYHIYPNLPYVLFFKDKGKVSRYLTKDCVMNQSCFKEKLKSFAN